MTVTHITDTLRTVQAPGDTDQQSREYCSNIFQQKLATTDPEFALYDITLTGASPSTDSYAKDCDVAANPDAKCQLQVTLNYGNQFVLTRETSRGISQLDIWLNIGAIVGAIQFFAWFVLQSVGG